MQVDKSIQVEMRDLSHVLAINLSESCLGVPSGASVEALLEHLEFQMAVDFCFEVISHSGCN
jgi:hypothetical protein